MPSLASDRSGVLHIVCKTLGAERLNQCLRIAHHGGSTVVLLPDASLHYSAFEAVSDDMKVYVVNDGDAPPTVHTVPAEHAISYPQFVDLVAHFPRSRSW